MTKSDTVGPLSLLDRESTIAYWHLFVKKECYLTQGLGVKIKGGKV